MRWLFDVIAIVALAWWQRARQWPGLRLVVGSGAPGKAQRGGVGIGVIGVLVSRPEMEARVRWALGGRAVVRVTTSWTELEQVISGTRPLAVFADPLADETGDPEGHLARFSRDWQMPVILYTTLTPACASRLIHLGQAGIRHVVFDRFDDNAERLNAIVDSLRPPHWPPPPPPLLVA